MPIFGESSKPREGATKQISETFPETGGQITVCKMVSFARNEVGSYDLNMVLKRAILGDLGRAGNSGR